MIYFSIRRIIKIELKTKIWLALGHQLQLNWRPRRIPAPAALPLAAATAACISMSCIVLNNPQALSDHTQGFSTFLLLSRASPKINKIAIETSAELVKKLIGAVFSSTYYMQEFWEENLSSIFPCYEIKFTLRNK